MELFLIIGDLIIGFLSASKKCDTGEYDFDRGCLITGGIFLGTVIIV